MVLGLLCAMYLITYVDRVNVATAASDIRRDLSLSNTQLGFVFSAFAYPYLFFQIFYGLLLIPYDLDQLFLCALFIRACFFHALSLS